MRRCFLLALLLLPALLRAQEEKRALTVDADFMTRGELRYGGLLPGEQQEGAEVSGERNRAAFILGRTRVGVGYKESAFSAKLTAQHSGTWGSDGSIGVYEAWARFDTKPGIFVQVGRQNLSYDDQRIFGSDDWSMTGMSHDALRFGYEGHGHKVHLMAAYNQNPENMDGGSYFAGGYQSYKAMEALWYHYDLTAWHLGASAVFMNVGMQCIDAGRENEQTFQQQMAGAYLTFQPKGWLAEAAYYHQFGIDESGLPIDAWMASGKVTATPSDAWQFYGGYDYLSGDPYFATPANGMLGVTRHEVVRGFNSLFGSHNKFYGAMDFFYVTTYVYGFTPGLQNAFAGVRWAPVSTFAFNAAYHYLAIATTLPDVKKSLGHEFEFSGSWNFLRNARLSVGYTFMQGTETMEILKRTPQNHHLHWAWLMLSVTPKMQKKWYSND